MSYVPLLEATGGDLGMKLQGKCFTVAESLVGIELAGCQVLGILGYIECLAMPVQHVYIFTNEMSQYGPAAGIVQMNRRPADFLVLAGCDLGAQCPRDQLGTEAHAQRRPVRQRD